MHTEECLIYLIAKRKKIESDLVEIRNNVFEHSKTEDPFFVCGQYYPKFEFFIFTMVDLGVGFLKPIQSFTDGYVSNMKDAIAWALNGNSSTGNDLAGLGLQSICEYMKTHNGSIQIYSGDVFWASDLSETVLGPYREMKHDFKGSILNLWFKNCT